MAWCCVCRLPFPKDTTADRLEYLIVGLPTNNMQGKVQGLTLESRTTCKDVAQ
jgi:hypothetical protein